MVRFGRQVSINSHSVNHTQQILQIHEISESLRSVITVIRCIACKFVKVLVACLQSSSNSTSILSHNYISSIQKLLRAFTLGR